MRGRPPIHTAAAAVFCALVFLAACGPKPIGFIKPDHPDASKYIVEGVALYYSHEDRPADAEIIDHITQIQRYTKCETAAIMAIVNMQKTALYKGGNALVNIKTVGEGKDSSSNEKGFWCKRSKAYEVGKDFTTKVWEITWEADVARLLGDMGEEDIGLPPPEGGGEGGGEETGGSEEGSGSPSKPDLTLTPNESLD